MRNLALTYSNASGTQTQSPTFPKVFNRSDFKIAKLGSGQITLEYMVFGELDYELRPLIILHSVEFPIPPSTEFCREMFDQGLQVIFVRRSGYGRSRTLPNVLLKMPQSAIGSTITMEAAILSLFMKSLKLRRAVLLAMGSANPAAYRLINLVQGIDFAIFANPNLNQDFSQEFQPHWLQRMLEQMVLARSGAQLAAFGLRHMIRKAPLLFFRQLFERSKSDLDYLNKHEPDFFEASRVSSALEVDMFSHEIRASLGYDNALSPAYFEGQNVLFLQGEETRVLKKNRFREQAQRMGVPVDYIPGGDMLAPYSSVDALLDLIWSHSTA